MSSNQFYKRLSVGFAVFYIIVSAASAVYNILYTSAYFIMLSFASFAFLFLPVLVNHVLKLKPTYAVNLTIYVFSFLAFVIGMAFRGYMLIPFYDKVVHAISGVVFSLFGLLLFYLIKPVKQIEKSDYRMAAWFSLCFSLFIAAIWEIYEYFINFILNNDPQHVLTTGVNDTMQDIIACLIGTLAFEILIRIYYKHGKRAILMGLFENFYTINIERKS